jgi:hypothetical protein
MQLLWIAADADNNFYDFFLFIGWSGIIFWVPTGLCTDIWVQIFTVLLKSGRLIKWEPGELICVNSKGQKWPLTLFTPTALNNSGRASALFTALTTLEIYNQNKRHKSGWWLAREHIILKTQRVRERARGVVPVHLNGNQPVSHIPRSAENDLSNGRMHNKDHVINNKRSRRSPCSLFCAAGRRRAIT